MRVLFGADYAEGAWPLVLIAIGQFAFCLCGPFNALLANGGRDREMVRLSYAVLVGSLALSFALIPSLEAVGAAIVLLCSSTALLVGQVWLSRDALAVSTVRGGAKTERSGLESDS
jgi:O-antigen/teichoic acid export membrane protein